MATPTITDEQLAIFREVQKAKRLARAAKMTEEQVAAAKAKRAEYNKAHLEAVKADPVKNAKRLAAQKKYHKARNATIKSLKAQLTEALRAAEQRSQAERLAQ